MTEKEAIVFLEAIKRGLHQTGKDHPYRDDLIPKMKEALFIAIEALERMTPKKVGGYRCPECNGDVECRIRFCPHCGQALYWRTK
jgi:hypothetical protein